MSESNKVGSSQDSKAQFVLKDIRGEIGTTKPVVIPSFDSIEVNDHTNIRGHCMRFHVVDE